MRKIWVHGALLAATLMLMACGGLTDSPTPTAGPPPVMTTLEGTVADDEQTEVPREATTAPAESDAPTPTAEEATASAEEEGTPESAEDATEATPTVEAEEEEEEEEAEEIVEGDPDEGAPLFATNCAACHGAEGQGAEAIIPPLAANPFVTVEEPQPVVEVVLNGRAGMPRFAGELSNDEVAHIVSFIRTAWENDASTISSELVSEVRQAPVGAQDYDAEEERESGNE